MNKNSTFQHYKYLKLRPIFEENIDKINLWYLSFNKNAIDLIEQHLNKDINNAYIAHHNVDIIINDKVNWNSVLNFLDIKNIDFFSLSTNEYAITLLEKYPNKINWISIWINPNIFTYNYKKIKQTNEILNKELIKYVFHPNRVKEWMFDELC